MKGADKNTFHFDDNDDGDDDDDDDNDDDDKSWLSQCFSYDHRGIEMVVGFLFIYLLES